MGLRPKIEECVGCFVCFNKNNLFFFNPTFLVAPLSVLQLKHHNLLEPRASCAKNLQNENLRTCNVDGGRWVVVVGGRSYLILEPVWWKPQCAAAALLSFHCCSVARGLGRGAPRRAPSQQQEVKSPCRAFQVITANGYRRWRWRRFCWIVRGMLTPTAMWRKLSESFCGCNRCARHLGNFWAAAVQITTQQHSQKVKLSLQRWYGN